jgi:sugar lactone lactonase YvrE
MEDPGIKLTRREFLIAGASCAPFIVAGCARTGARSARPDELEQVARFNGPMPTGVTVSQEGRIFVNFPRWGDPVPFTVAEVRNGNAVAYPDEDVNRLDAARAADTFVSVQSVVVDPRNRLWVLDTGSIAFAPVIPDGPKLVGIDLATNRIFRTIRFPADVALKTTYLNDVRFDLRHGKDGIAYITDSSGGGPNAIIVVDLATGQSWRRLHDHPSTKAEKGFVPVVDGQPLMRGQPPQPMTIGADGVAISADGERLYYCALSSRRLYSIATSALRDAAMSDPQVAATVHDEGLKTGASDGLESDAQGRLYVTDYEHNAIHRRRIDGAYETLARDPRLSWPDTLALAGDGHLYVIANQLHRQPVFQNGSDLRVKPYLLLRLKTDGRPVVLR